VRKDQLFDLIRRINNLTGISVPFIVGSHCVFAVTDRVPSIVSQSIEADFLLAQWGIAVMEKVNEELGVTSNFYDQYGYHADALGMATVVLVPGWESRLQPLIDDNGQTVAQCLELHDVAVSKLMAGREKDYIFISALLDGGLISLETLIERAALIRESHSVGALLPRLKSLNGKLRSTRTYTELKPLLDLIRELESNP
jgi:hypothetical protein